MSFIYGKLPSYSANYMLTLPLGAKISSKPNLSRDLWRASAGTAWVRIFASCSLDLTKGMSTNFRSNFSLMKCRSTSMCLVRSCCTGLLAISRAAWLSHYSNIGSLGSKPIYVSKVLSHNSSHIPCTIPLYSASAEDLAVTFCFLLRHVTRFPATNVK
jgi:hypothetical protein